jgi:uncharacterized repeat protein (TIGR03803 family)
MIRTKLTRTLALAGFAPAGKSGNGYQARSQLAAIILRVSASWLACTLAAIGMATAQAQMPVETVLHTFGSVPKGAYPYAGVIRGSAGNLYGTTYQGGTANAGVVYGVDTAGHETVLYSFTGLTDGGNPYAGVAPDSAGNLYGTTSAGGSAQGSAGYGVVYKLDPSGTETVLYTFTGGADGGTPYAGVIRDSAGNLYGTTGRGGTATCPLNYLGPAGCGVVYKVDTTGHETVLYTFSGGADGGSPYGAGLTRDPAGNLYGTTEFGGTASVGVVFKLDTTGQETVLYSFIGLADFATDGVYPGAGVILDSAGNLYGTTMDGGGVTNPGCGGDECGVVFKLDPSGQETVLHAFTGGADGAEQYFGVFEGGVIRDPAGNLYGTTYLGGDLSGCYAEGCGVVFKMSPSGQETVLYTFTGGADGGNPYAGVIADPAGNLYGTTYNGGKNSAGVVFKLKPQ